MFRRSSSTASASATGHRRRTVRRSRQREATDDAALRARLERMNRRLAEVGSVQVAARAQGIDNDTARRDPMTRPFSAPVDALPVDAPAVETPRPQRRTDTAAMARPA